MYTIYFRIFISIFVFCYRPTSSNKQWMIKSDNNLNLVILGSNGLAEEFSNNLKVIIFWF